MTDRHAKVLASADVVSQTQAMRLSMGAWILRADNRAASAWRRSAEQARTAVATLQASADGDEAEAALIRAVAHQLDDRIATATPLLATVPAQGQEARVAQMMGASYQTMNAAMTSALEALTDHEQEHLRRMAAAERIALGLAGVLLLGLGGWSVTTLRHSRAGAAAILRSLEESFAETDQGRAELHAFTHAAPLAVFHADATGRPHWLNAKASAWVGHREGDDAAHFIRDGIVADDRRRVTDAWERLVETGDRFDQAFRFVGLDGDTVWIRAHASPVVVAGVATGFVAVVQDITASRVLQDEVTQSRLRMRRMADGVPALLARLDETETYRFVNATYRAWFGDGAPRIGSTLREFLGEETYALFSPVFVRVRKGEAVRFEMRRLSLHGRQFVGDVSYSPDHDEDGLFCGMYVMVHDISERKQLEESLFAAKELAQVTLESIADAVLTTDRYGAVTFLNRRAEALLNKPAVRARGLPIDALVQLREPDGSPSQTALLRAIREERVVDVLRPRQLVVDDGVRIDVEDVAAPIRDRDGQVVGGVLVLRDVSVAQAVAERMRQLAESDGLTGLPNRMVFEQRLRALLAHLQPDETLAVLYMDLDGFKSVNDLYGHGAGDELLRQFSARLMALTAPADMVCRLGGDEFVALLAPPVSLREAVVRAEAFIDAAIRPFTWQDQQLWVTLSVGIAEAPLHGSDAQLLVKRADDALYAAKDAGKNQARVAD
jgi:diguanylate cyclase (GGDEF)-like protein/PAS domain S-box-containing protein